MGTARREKNKGRSQGLTEEQNQEIREAFDLFDTDGSGMIDPFIVSYDSATSNLSVLTKEDAQRFTDRQVCVFAYVVQERLTQRN